MQVDGPEWYTRGLDIPEEVQGESPTSAKARQATLETVLDIFEVLQGEAAMSWWGRYLAEASAAGEEACRHVRCC